MEKGPPKSRHLTTCNTQLARRAVSCVADDGVAKGCEVDPDLMRPAGFGVGREKREIAEPPHDFISGKRLSRSQSACLHAGAPDWIASHGLRDLAPVAADLPVN